MNEKLIRKYKEFIGDNELFETLVSDNERKENRRIKTNKVHRKTKCDEVFNEFDSLVTDAYSFQSTPKYIKGTLREYQIEGVNWLISMHENQINCILADEMGLGKTLQTITFLGYLKFYKKETLPHLLVVPKSIFNNWKTEFAKFIPEIKIYLFHTSKKELKKNADVLNEMDFDVCITTYEMCLLAKSAIKNISWSYIVIDEAHRIKNEKSMLSKMVRYFNCKHRLLLTGTPLQNNIHELWALLNFLVPELFSNSEKFEKWVMEADKEDSKSVEKLRRILQVFFLRREKREVEQTLLPKKIINLYPQLSGMQRKWYKMILERDLTPILGKKGVKSLLMNIVCQLRKCCNHPYLFDGAEPGPPYTTDVHLIENCGKMILLDKLLYNLKSKGSRVLIFSQMARMLDILEDYCIFKEYKYCRIDGSTSTEERSKAIEDYNSDDSDKFIFLLTTRAGGLGINLATADCVVLYDADWNPQMDLQAQDRAHRIGQKKQVYIFRLITENTIEEKIIQRSLQKLKLDEILVQNRETIDPKINQKELLEILATGVEKVFEQDEGFKDKDIEEIIRIGEEKTQELNSKLEGLKLSETSGGGIRLYEWEGEDYRIKNKFYKYLNQSRDTKPRTTSFSKKIRPHTYHLPEYQFFPNELKELQEKEIKIFDEDGSVLTEEEQKLKADLYEQGFKNWTKKDYFLFIKACETKGKENISEISSFFPNKTEEDVKKYHKVFWDRINELSEHEKILSQIIKGEARTKKFNKLKNLLNEKIKNDDFNLFYVPGTRSKYFTEAFDKFILKSYYENIELGNCYELIRKELHRRKEFRLNYFILTRNSSDIQKRISILTSNILKQCDEDKREEIY